METNLCGHPIKVFEHFSNEPKYKGEVMAVFQDKDCVVHFIVRIEGTDKLLSFSFDDIYTFSAL